MDFIKVRIWFAPLAFSFAVIALSLILYVKTKFVFDSGNEAAGLVFASLLSAILAFILALLSLPRWLGILAGIIALIVVYMIVFTRLYGLS